MVQIRPHHRQGKSTALVITGSTASANIFALELQVGPVTHWDNVVAGRGHEGTARQPQSADGLLADHLVPQPPPATVTELPGGSAWLHRPMLMPCRCDCQ